MNAINRSAPLAVLAATIKGILFVVLIIFYLATSSIWKIFIPKLAVRRHFYVRTVSFYAKLMLFFANIRVRSAGMPPREQHHLIVANHVGMLDILIIASQRPSLFVTSVDLRETPGLGLLTEMGGCMYVERRSRSNITNEIQEIREALKQGFNVVIFPEATSTNGEKVIPFKKTLLTAAAGTQVPILPVCLNYRTVNGEPMSHKWRDHVFWYGDLPFPTSLWRHFSLLSLRAELDFLQPILCHTEEDRRVVAQQAYEAISSRYTPLPIPSASSSMATTFPSPTSS